MRNESRHIAATLQAILDQDYPAECLEVIVADGRSTDDSREIVAGLISGRTSVSVLDNPRLIQSCGWNLGIEHSSGEIVTIVSAHCELAPDYVSRAVETLRRTRAALVGGPMTAVSSGDVGEAIARATSSPFGVGGARFHYATSESEVDTVYQGFCWRELYASLGGFDPEMVRNQDDELSFRIRAAGGRIVCNPAIRSRYHNRSTLRSLMVQYNQYGFWKVRLMQKCASQMQPRHFAPSLFVAATLLMPVAGLWFSPVLKLWILMLATYMCANLFATVRVAKGQPIGVIRLIPMVFPLLHFSYGLGFLKGLFVWPWRGKPGTAPRLSMRSVPSAGADR